MAVEGENKGQTTLNVSQIDVMNEDIGDRFVTEKAMSDYLENNLALFVAEITNEELESYQRESYLSYKAFGANKPRIDFFITCKSGRNILIECKNPSQVQSDMSRAISQLLVYATLASKNTGFNPDKLLLVTTRTVPVIQETIERYELPIDVVVMTKKTLALWSRDV